MGNRAIVFSGQGAQYKGMGQSLYENYKSAREIFERAEKIRPGTIKQCFLGTAEELSQTVNTQPCLFTVDAACGEALRESGITGNSTAGFSLGELAALFYAKVLGFEECFKLVCKRAEIMHAVSLEKKGAMAAVLKADAGTVERLCRETGGVYAVNYNCEGQTVIAGGEEEIKTAAQKLTAAGAKVINLPVSGAFHSPYMDKAYNLFLQETNKCAFKNPQIPVYSNVTAKPYEKEGIAKLLASQVKSPVLWQKTIENMIGSGTGVFIEAGAGKTLTNLIKRISDKVLVYSAENSEGVKAAAAGM